MTELIRRPAGNIVLEFKEIGSGKRTITLTATDEEGVFEMERGITALNQITDKRIVKGADEVRAIWIDAVVNGFQMTKNEVFMRGVKDVLGIAPGTKFPKISFVDTPAPHTESTMEIAVPDYTGEIQGGCAPTSSSVIINESNP